MNLRESFDINPICIEIGLSQEELNILMGLFSNELSSNKGWIYRDALRRSLLRYKELYPKTHLRVWSTQAYLNILRRARLIGYKEWIKHHCDIYNGRFVLMNQSELKTYIRKEEVRKRLLKIFSLSPWFFSGLEKFLREEQELLAKKNKDSWKIYSVPPAWVRHLMRLASWENNPSVSLESFEKIFWYSEEVRKILEIPWKTRRIATKEQILWSIEFKEFITLWLKRIQKEGKITRFSEAFLSLIREWNQQDASQTLYIPQNIYQSGNDLSLCKILWIKWYKNNDILTALWIQRNVWKPRLGLWTRIAWVRKRTKNIQNQLNVMITTK
jgi:hypothetical protein